MLRVALAQINATVGLLPGNQKKILEYIGKAAALDAHIVVFPELALCGYPPEDLLHKEHFVRNNVKHLRAIARQVRDITAIVGFVDVDESGRIYNAAAVIRDGLIHGVFRKEELPNYSVFDEKRYFTNGSHNPVFVIDGVLVGINICEDIWVDDGCYARQAQGGCQLLINVSSSPYHVGKIRAREALIRRRARSVKLPVCYVNMVGGQDELIFDGGSFVVNSKGELVASGRQFAEELVIADLDLIPAPQRDLRKKDTQQPVIVVTKKSSPSDSLTESEDVNVVTPHLEEVEEIYYALVMGTRDYIRKNGFQRVVIGLSGGIDSALVAVIAVDAVGADNVVGVSMPSPFNSKGTQSDARTLAENLGIEFMEVPISRVYNSYRKTLMKWLGLDEPTLAEENLQARIRGNILMAFSNKFGWLVLTTGNKSEMAVGYCTLYGDMSGGFAVIKDVMKTRVYQLSRFRNNLQGQSLIPKSILMRPPSAELREGQKDEDSLPPYDVLDRILVDYVEKHHSVSKMARKAKNRQVVTDVIRLVDRSEYKRRQSPPGIKITPRAFGKDWRLPITNRYSE